MTKQFSKTINAALAQTKSIFALAEALLIEIPPRENGRGRDVQLRLQEALDAIVAAGGEPLSLSTLRAYRDVAVWAADANVPTAMGTLRWVPKVSFKRHRLAYEGGVSFADFTANPTVTRPARPVTTTATRSSSVTEKKASPKASAAKVKKATPPPPRAARAVERNPQTQVNVQEMAKARDLAKVRDESLPISIKQLAEQESLSVTDVRRKLALASLPAEIQTLVETRQLAIMSAEYIAKCNLEQHEKIAFARKVMDGKVPEAREAIQDALRAMDTWSQEARTSFLSSADMPFTEARKLHLEVERTKRADEATRQQMRAALRGGDHSFHWVSASIIDQFNQSVEEMARNPQLVDPMIREMVKKGLMDAIERAATALDAMGFTAEARMVAQLVLDTVTMPAPVRPMITGVVVNGAVVTD